MLNPQRFCRYFLVLFLAVTGCVPSASAYSVLTHEALIDLAWNDCIRPMLLKKFPGATDAQLLEAHAYAYGGSAIQDMGYYPFGKEFFSDLTHYVRSGDFIAWLLDNAHTMDEYAFAIGALSHYLGDAIGHFEAVNPATAVQFPKLKHKYGTTVTYDEDPHAHIRTEFAFDVEELSDGSFAPPAYLRFVGFAVPRQFLEQAFINTYGFDIHDVLGKAHPALRSYRTSVRSFIPRFADAEVVLHRHQFPPHAADETSRVFHERLAQTNYERHWKHARQGPGFGSHLLAILVFLVPKIGAASDLAIKIPTPESQHWYLRSVNHTVDVFRETLSTLAADSDGAIRLANIDLDTGERVALGDYPRADATYARLLQRVTSKPERVLPEDLKRNILEYYAGYAGKSGANAGVQAQLATLQGMKTGDHLATVSAGQ